MSANNYLLKGHFMKKMLVFSAVILAPLLVATFGIGHAQAQKRVAGVHIVHPGEDLEAKSRVFKLPNYMDFYQDVPGDTFLVMPTTAGGKIEVFAVDMGNDGKLHLGTKQWGVDVLSARAGFVLRHVVSEGIPNLAVCILGQDRRRDCWIPRNSGADGSLILDAGFYPVRVSGENRNNKKYSQETRPLLTDTDLIDQPQVFVERLKDAKHLASLAAKHQFVPKGEFKPEMPHHFLFVPQVQPTTVRLHVMHNQAGDGTIDPVPVAAIPLKNDEAAVFSIDLAAFADRSTDEENFEYTFVVADDKTGEVYHWIPRINHETGRLDGYGLGPLEKLVYWPY